MNTEIVSIVNKTSSSTSSYSGIKEGSVVSGRVVSGSGGNYIVSIAGKNISVRSFVPLETGSSFKARIHSDNGKIVLSLLGNAGAEKSFVTNIPVSAKNISSNAYINELLTSLGLPVTEQSFRLLQFAKESGIRIAPDKFRRILNSSDDDDTAQTELLLSEKGMTMSDDSVSAVLYGGGNDSQSDKNNSGQNECQPDSDEITSENVKEFFEQAEEAAGLYAEKAGALTVFNSLSQSGGDGSHWLVFPFEWDFNDFSGNIRILLSADHKNVKKIVVDCRNSFENDIIVLYLNKQKIESAKFTTSKKLSDEQKSFYEELLHSILKRNTQTLDIADVCFSDSLSAFCPADDSVSVVRGEA